MLVGVGTGYLCGERTKGGPPCGVSVAWDELVGKEWTKGGLPRGSSRAGASWLETNMVSFFFSFSPCGVGGGSAFGCVAGAGRPGTSSIVYFLQYYMFFGEL